MKLITFTVPCYNSAAYMSHCIETLLPAGEDAEIILVDVGSKDDTGKIADEYAAKYPTIVRVIHQENGGHGEGVNQGIRNATGMYFKVVDSDDWLDDDALAQVMDVLRAQASAEKPVDLVMANYVYEHVADNTRNVVDYTGILPEGRVFKWSEIGHFPPNKNILMHSVIYRTEVLRKSGMVLPKHTFYVDNIFVYQPLPEVETIYYLNLDLYRYFIGRDDQSVNESVMMGRRRLRAARHPGQAARLYAELFLDDDGNFQHLPDAGRQCRSDGKAQAALGRPESPRRPPVPPLPPFGSRGLQPARLAGQQAEHRRLPHRAEAVQVQLRGAHAIQNDFIRS